MRNIDPNADFDIDFTLREDEDAITTLFNSEKGVTFNGNAGANSVVGGLGDDDIIGNAGDDTLIGGEGNNTLSGSRGSDTASYIGLNTSVTADLSSETAQFEIESGDSFTDQLLNIENLEGIFLDWRETNWVISRSIEKMNQVPPKQLDGSTRTRTNRNIHQLLHGKAFQGSAM